MLSTGLLLGMGKVCLGRPSVGAGPWDGPTAGSLSPAPDLLLLTPRSYLAIPASSWVDDFIDWLTPSSCCRLYAFGANKDQFCPSTVSEYGVSEGSQLSIAWGNSGKRMERTVEAPLAFSTLLQGQ